MVREYMEIGPAMQGFGDPMVVAMLEVMSLDEATGQNSAGGGASQHSGNGFGYSADQPGKSDIPYRSLSLVVRAVCGVLTTNNLSRPDLMLSLIHI